MHAKPYRDYSSYLREVFGCRVQKISVDAGLTCPNRDGFLSRDGCVYCNERGSGTGAASRFTTISEQLEMGKITLAKRYKAKKFLAYFQSFSNTYAPLPVLSRLYEEALSVPDIVGLNIGTRPDCVPDEILDYLEILSRRVHVWMEYGLQSSNNTTLSRIRRSHTSEAFIDAVERTRKRGIPVCSHVILGLPGETREDMLKTARFLAALDIQGVKIHILYVIRGTTLEKWYRNGQYSCLSREAYVSIISQFLTLLPPHIIVQRLTGDPHPEELVAPRWTLEKQKNLQAILDYMTEKELYQGKAHKLEREPSGPLVRTTAI